MSNDIKKFTYHRKSQQAKGFIGGLTAYLMIESALGLFLILLLIDSVTIKSICATALSALTAYAIFSLAYMLVTVHSVSADGITIRQGTRFKGFIPHDKIGKAEQTRDKLDGRAIAVRYIAQTGTLQVTTDEDNLVSISLAKPLRRRLSKFRKPVDINRFLINVDEPDAFIDAVNGIIGNTKADAPATTTPAAKKIGISFAPIAKLEPAEYAIETNALCKSYNSLKAVDRLTLGVKPGEIFGFLGPNGAGKTTTINMLVGLLKPTDGKALINGIDIWSEPLKAKAIIGYVPDTAILYERLTGREFLYFMAQLYDTADGAKERIEELLKLIEMDDWADQQIKVYSFGMRRKIAIAGALVHKPQILVLDEPTNGLDPRSARRVKDLLRRLSAEGMTIFMSTHVLEIAERMCDRIGVIYKGTLVAIGSMDELRQQTQMAGSDLESIFLSVTGGRDDAEVTKEL
jgi:ABC-2 type transport system ATP-binding protein